MKKKIKAQYYIPWTSDEDISDKCSVLNDYTKEIDAYYEFFESEYGDETVCCIYLESIGYSFKECNENIKQILKWIKIVFHNKPKQIISVKLDVI